MKIRILGCHGSELPGMHLSSYLIDDSVILDAGGLTSTLNFEEQKKIKHILISHSHLDHIKDIAFLADNLQEAPATPIEIISSEEVIRAIKEHLFNNRIWPDFTKLPSEKKPILKYRPIEVNTPFKIAGLEINTIYASHVVPTVSYFISKNNSTVLFTADTGPTNKIWEEANKINNLKAVFIDTTFPNKMQGLADKSKHLTPQKLREELKKLKQKATIYSYHNKGRFKQELEQEIKKCCKEVITLKEGEILNF